MGVNEEVAREQEALGVKKKKSWVIFSDKVGDVA